MSFYKNKASSILLYRNHCRFCTAQCFQLGMTYQGVEATHVPHARLTVTPIDRNAIQYPLQKFGKQPGSDHSAH